MNFQDWSFYLASGWLTQDVTRFETRDLRFQIADETRSGIGNRGKQGKKVRPVLPASRQPAWACRAHRAHLVIVHRLMSVTEWKRQLADGHPIPLHHPSPGAPPQLGTPVLQGAVPRYFRHVCTCMYEVRCLHLQTDLLDPSIHPNFYTTSVICR